MRPFQTTLFYFVSFFLFIAGFSCSKADTNSPSDIGQISLAKLSVSSMVAKTKTYVIISSSVNNNGNSNITQKGFCWSQNPNPTISNNFIVSSSSSTQNIFIDTIKGLRYNTLYYIRSYATNSAGTAYGPELQIMTENTNYSIGQVYGGGKICYIDSTGEHGLIYYVRSKYYNYQWATWPYTGSFVGNTQYNLGTGKQNTQNILLSGNNAANTAAKICDDFVYGGYSDWFLPSSEELVTVRAAIPFIDPQSGIIFTGGLFWTSTETSGTKARILPIHAIADFSSDSKDAYWGVIPVREF